jgi:hypothetical protein
MSRIYDRIAACAANLDPRRHPPNVVWQSGALSMSEQQGSSDKKEEDRTAVADMGLRRMVILRALTVNGVPWQDVHFSIYVGMPGNIKLVQWDHLEAVVLVALMSA